LIKAKVVLLFSDLLSKVMVGVSIERRNERMGLALNQGFGLFLIFEPGMCIEIMRLFNLYNLACL